VKDTLRRHRRRREKSSARGSFQVPGGGGLSYDNRLEDTEAVAASQLGRVHPLSSALSAGAMLETNLLARKAATVFGLIPIPTVTPSGLLMSGDPADRSTILAVWNQSVASRVGNAAAFGGPAHPLLLETPALCSPSPDDSAETIVADLLTKLILEKAAGCYLDVNH
jgi:hypothetical protein